MAGKKNKSEEELKEKTFLSECKLFLSTLTSRAVQFAYLNIAPNTIILSNSTSTGPGIEHGDKLMNYSVGELCIHVVTLKNSNF